MCIAARRKRRAARKAGATARTLYVLMFVVTSVSKAIGTISEALTAVAELLRLAFAANVFRRLKAHTELVCAVSKAAKANHAAVIVAAADSTSTTDHTRAMTPAIELQ